MNKITKQNKKQKLNLWQREFHFFLNMYIADYHHAMLERRPGFFLNFYTNLNLPKLFYSKPGYDLAIQKKILPLYTIYNSM